MRSIFRKLFRATRFQKKIFQKVFRASRGRWNGGDEKNWFWFCHFISIFLRSLGPQTADRSRPDRTGLEHLGLRYHRMIISSYDHTIISSCHHIIISSYHHVISSYHHIMISSYHHTNTSATKVPLKFHLPLLEEFRQTSRGKFDL